jgi:hypothetical protein
MARGGLTGPWCPFCRIVAERSRLFDLAFDALKRPPPPPTVGVRGVQQALDDMLKTKDFFWNSGLVCDKEANKVLGLLRLADANFKPNCSTPN